MTWANAKPSRFGGTNDESWRNSVTGQPGMQWIAEQPSNQAAMLGGDTLKKFGFSGPMTIDSGPPDNLSRVVNPELTAWLESNNYNISPDWTTANGMTTSLKDGDGKTLASQSSGNDDGFWKAAMLAAAVTGAGVYGAGSGAAAGGTSAGAVDAAALGLDGAAGFGGLEAGTGALGIDGATYALPGAEGGFSFANTGAVDGTGLYGGAAADSHAANLAMQAAGTPTGAAIGPASVNLLNAGGTASLGGGWLSRLGGLLPNGSGSIGMGDLAKIGLNVGSAVLQSNASRRASQLQSDAAGRANQLQQDQFAQTRADNAPLLASRNDALSQIANLLKNPSGITSDPGYKFGMDQGTRGLNAGAASRGMTYSGAEGKALERFGQDYAGTKLDASYNRLSNLAGLGQVGANNNMQAGMNYVNNAGNNIIGAGNAQAASGLNQGNIYGNLLNAGSAYGQRQGWFGGNGLTLKGYNGDSTSPNFMGPN